MTRRRWVGAIAALIIVGGVIAGVAVTSSGSSGSASASATKTKTSTSLQTVERRTLSTTQDVSGTIGFGTPTNVTLGGGSSSTAASSSSASSSSARSTTAATTAASTSSGSGTITALPAVGSTIQAGQSLAEIDGTPSAFLMIGTRPVWRTLTSGITDGPDVLQLEQTLAVLGYGGSLTVDSTFTSGTASAIDAFQRDRGITETGELTTQQVVFLPGTVRVASQTGTIGGSATGGILTVTGTTPQIHVDLDASLVASAKLGDVAAVDLPNSKTVNGTIFGVGAATSTTATGQGNQGSTTTTTVGVTLVVPGTDLAQFDGAAVVIHLVTAQATDALSVPVKSLLALAEGGYAVERVRGGVHQLVKATPGTFAGGFVQVTGDLRVGDSVVTP